VLNDIFAHEDMIPTIMAAAGVPDVVEQLKKGMNVGGKTFKVHLDGYNITDALAGKSASPRHEFFYFNDDGSLVALRVNQWKIVFAEQRAHGFDVWEEPFVELRLPRLFNLRADPFEQASTAGSTGSGASTGRSCSCRRSSMSVSSRHLQGVPAEPEGRELQPRPGAREAAGNRLQMSLQGRIREIDGCGPFFLEEE